MSARIKPGRSQKTYPAPARGNPLHDLELQVERIWLQLQGLRRGTMRIVALSPRTGQLQLARPRSDELPGEIGTYTRAVDLAQLRADVFHVFEGKKR